MICLGRRTREVEHQVACLDGEAAGDLEEVVVPLGPALRPIDARRELFDACAHRRFGEVSNRGDAFNECFSAH